MEALEHFTLHFYGVFLCIQYLAAAQGYVSVVDWAALVPPQTEEQYKAHFLGSYYIFYSHSPDFAAIRNGITMVVECEGAGLQNVRPHFMERIASDFYSHYPRKFKEVYFLNSPTVISIEIGWWRLPHHKERREDD